MHFQHKCLVTAGLSEPAVGTVPGQMLSVGRVAASGFSGPPTRSASFCLHSFSICNAVAQWPVFKDKGDEVEKPLGFCESGVSHNALEADLFIYPGVRQQP